MSYALMVHKEANGVNGGVIDPIGGAFASDTFYIRKLTHLLVNQGSTVASFDGAAYTFTLAPGNYRIEARALFNQSALAGGTCLGLYNVSSAAFEVQTGGTIPILSTNAAYANAGGRQKYSNNVVDLSGHVIVTGTNKTYQLRHKGFPAISTNVFCGVADQMAGANVNGAAAYQYYMTVSVRKETL